MQLYRWGVNSRRGKIFLLGTKETNDLLSKKIAEGKPLMVTRFGSVEFFTMTTGKGFTKLYSNAGFFPYNKKLIKEFTLVYRKSIENVDILAVWIYKYSGFLHWWRKLKIIKKLESIECLIELHSLNPYENIWFKELTDKKVLVVHPFKKSIERQYLNRKNLDIIPEFKSLEVIKAIQTIGDEIDPRFSSWFEALDYMKKEISTKDFDVCLIGCGAYGLPLASYVKGMNKQAIHIGGALQLLFGIKGNRWETEYNFDFGQHWIYPLNEDTPLSAKKIEDGCYW